MTFIAERLFFNFKLKQVIKPTKFFEDPAMIIVINLSLYIEEAKLQQINACA